MTEIAKYRCKSCGVRFEVQVLTERERREAERERRPVYGISCKKCGSRDVQRD